MENSTETFVPTVAVADNVTYVYITTMSNLSHVIAPTAINETTLVNTFSALNGFGLFLNSLVMYVVWRHKVVPGKAPRTFLMNQLINEWLCCLFRSFAWFTDAEWPVPDNVWGTVLCKMMYTRAIYYTIMHASYTNLVLLSAERYITVVHPTLHKRFTTPVIAVSIFFSWASGFVRAVNRYIEPARNGSSCITLPIDIRPVATMTYFWSLVIPVITIACFNGHVIYVLKQQDKKMNTRGTVNPGGSARKRLQREMTHSVLMICISFVLTVAPFLTVHVLMAYYTIYRDFRGLLYVSLTCWASAFYIINPFICIFLMHSIRKHIIAILCCYSIRKRNTASETNAVSTVSRRDFDKTTGYSNGA